MTGFFVSGTDTGCGKTTVGAVLARSLRSSGKTVRVVKPIETGVEQTAAGRLPLDARALAEAADDPRGLERICPYQLLLPAAPDVAARQEGVTIELEMLRKAYADASSEAEVVLVEGAGGVLVPILDGLDMLGLAAALELPLLLVARAALGTINHTLLSLEAARARGVPVVGVAISHTAPDLSAADRSNLDRLLEELPVPCLGELAHGSDALEPQLSAEALMALLAEPSPKRR